MELPEVSWTSKTLILYGIGIFINGDLPGTPKDPLYGKLVPHDSHIFRDSCGSGMGIVMGRVKGPIIGDPKGKDSSPKGRIWENVALRPYLSRSGF